MALSLESRVAAGEFSRAFQGTESGRARLSRRVATVEFNRAIQSSLPRREGYVGSLVQALKNLPKVNRPYGTKKRSMALSLESRVAAGEFSRAFQGTESGRARLSRRVATVEFNRAIQSSLPRREGYVGSLVQALKNLPKVNRPYGTKEEAYEKNQVSRLKKLPKVSRPYGTKEEGYEKNQNHTPQRRNAKS